MFCWRPFDDTLQFKLFRNLPKGLRGSFSRKMLFDDKKIEIESIEELMQCPVSSVHPYALMLAPIYVLMKKNQKLVSVKAPLDFFVPSELETMKVYQRFYIPKFINSVSRFQTAAKLAKSLLKTPCRDEMGIAPYEISKEMLSVLGPLWGKDFRVEAFFAAVFTDEFCGSLDPEKMLRAREETVVRHDLGILLSGLIVFSLLHLGWFDYELLQTIRNETYDRTVMGDRWDAPTNPWEAINQDLILQVEESIPLDRDSLSLTEGEWAKKILGRMKDLEKTPPSKRYESLSIFGPEGFAA